MHAQREFDPEPVSPAAVRAFVCETADVDISHPAVLVASELAANAVLHAKCRFSVTIDSDEKIRLSVEDTSAELPQHDVSPPRPGRLAPGGEGLRLIDALSIRWGFDATRTGKRVWAEVATEAPVERDALDQRFHH